MAEQDRIPTDGSQRQTPSTPETAPPDAGSYAPPQAAPAASRPPGAFAGIFPPGANDFAILSLVIAVGGMATGMATSPVSIVLGFMALSRIKRTGERGREMAIAGILIGFLLLLIVVAIFAMTIVYMFVTLDVYSVPYGSRR